MTKLKSEHIEVICINALTEELAKVRSLVDKYLISIGFSEEKSFNIQLVVDEVCSNIIKHSYSEIYSKNPEIKNTLKICLELQKNDTGLIIRIIDQGPPFNPIEYQSPNIKDHISHPHKGGLGIPLIKLLSDRITYTIENNNPIKNVLEIEFFLN